MTRRGALLAPESRSRARHLPHACRRRSRLIVIAIADRQRCFEHGVFTEADAVATATALAAFALGPSRLLHEQDFLTGLFRARGHPAADDVCDALGHRECRDESSCCPATLAMSESRWRPPSPPGSMRVLLCSTLSGAVTTRLMNAPQALCRASCLRASVMGARPRLQACSHAADFSPPAHPLMLRALAPSRLVVLGSWLYFTLAHLTQAMRWAEFTKMVRR